MTGRTTTFINGFNVGPDVSFTVPDQHGDVFATWDLGFPPGGSGHSGTLAVRFVSPARLVSPVEEYAYRLEEECLFVWRREVYHRPDADADALDAMFHDWGKAERLLLLARGRWID